MKKIAALVGLFATLAIGAAHAQSTPPLAAVVPSCGSATYSAGANRPITQDTTGLQCTGAAITPSGQQAVSDTAGADSSGTFTNATQTTSVTATLETGTNSYSTVTVTVNGTYGTASAVFEKSDDDTLTNWYPVQCSQEGQGVLETGYSSLTNTARMWQCNTQGANAFRVRSTAVASGTVAILISPSGMPTANGATVAVGPSIDGTGSGSLTTQDAGSTTTSCYNGSQCITGTATAGSTVSIATNGRTATSTQFSGTWSGTVQFEGSLDSGVTWIPFSAHARGTASATVSSTGNGVFVANTSGLTNYRVRFITKVSGTVSVLFAASSEEGVVYVNNAIKLLDLNGTNQASIKAASTAPAATDTSLVVALNPNAPVNVSGDVAAAAADSGNPVKVGGVYNSAAPTYTTGQRANLQADSHGSLKGLQVDSTGAAIDYTQNLSFNPYPGGAVPVSCSTGNVAAATATCTMPATTGKTTYVTGFDITGSGATLGSAITCTLTNTNSGTMSFTFIVTAGVLLADTSLIKSFAPALKATASNTAPVLSCPSFGTGSTNATINAAGYEL